MTHRSTRPPHEGWASRSGPDAARRAGPPAQDDSSRGPNARRPSPGGRRGLQRLDDLPRADDCAPEDPAAVRRERPISDPSTERILALYHAHAASTGSHDRARQTIIARFKLTALGADRIIGWGQP